MKEQETSPGKFNQFARWLFGVRPPLVIRFETSAVQLKLPELTALALELNLPEKLFLFRPMSNPLLPEINQALLSRPDTHTVTQAELDLPLPPALPLQISLLLDIPGRYQFATNILLEAPHLYAPQFKPSSPTISDLTQKAFDNWQKPTTVDLIQFLTGQNDLVLEHPQQYQLPEQPWLTPAELETLNFKPEPLPPEDLTASYLHTWPEDETENVFYLLTGKAESQLDLPEHGSLEEPWELIAESILQVELRDLAIPFPEIDSIATDSLLNSATVETIDLLQLLVAGRVLGKNYESERIIKAFKGGAEESIQNKEQSSDICIHGLLKSTCDICSHSKSKRQRSSKLGDRKAPIVINVFDLLLPYLQPPIDAITDWSSIFPPGKPLLKFQASGSYFLINNNSALLADEMGLGKSIQAIFALRILFRRTRKPITTLILCPKSLVKDWEKKLEEWAPELRVTTITGSSALRTALWQVPSHVHLAGYDTLTADIDELKKTRYDVVILDEVQAIKSASTKRTKAVRKIEAEWRWGLSATPLENHPDDLVSIFAFLKPGLLIYADAQNRTQLKNKIKPYMLRRRIQDVQDEIKLEEQFIDKKPLELTPEQRQRYDEVLGQAKRNLKPLTLASGSRAASGTDFEIKRKVLAEITELKKICNFDPVTEKSCKAEYLQQMLPNICEVNEKALIFSQYPNKSLQPLARALKKFQPDLFDGSLSNAKRDEKIQEFQESNKTNVLLMSVKAGGVGITLHRANHVFFLDQWWNPATGKQAIGRAYRIGQKKKVYVTILYAVNTIEERILSILERKQQIFDEIIDDQSDKIYETITVEELFEILGMVQFDVILEDPGKAIGRTIQVVSELTGLNDYQKARQLLQKLPVKIMGSISREQAEEVKRQLEETSGAKVDIRANYI